jgi:lipoprotein signal peptidase
MADCWIVVGVAVLMLQMYLEEDPADPEEEGVSDEQPAG